jgi:phosphoribosylamine--glycine ligase
VVQKGQNRALVTSGGRVLGVTALGSNLKEALEKHMIKLIHIYFEGMHYRRGYRQKIRNMLTSYTINCR